MQHPGMFSWTGPRTCFTSTVELWGPEDSATRTRGLGVAQALGSMQRELRGGSPLFCSGAIQAKVSGR